MAKAIFLRVLEPKPEEKGTALAAAVQSAREGHLDGRSTFTVDPSSFRQVQGAPFAYWVSDSLRRKFRELPPFESEGRTVKQGLATADDFRFVRAWWEVDSRRILHVPAKAEKLDDPGRLREYQEACREQTRHGKRWVPFAKGGAYSPYYADVYLVVDWENDGERIKDWIVHRYPYLKGKWQWVAKNPDYYFRPGLTFPRRTWRFSPWLLPSGCLFSHGGQAIFASTTADLALVLFLTNSWAFHSLVQLRLGREDIEPQYEVGIIQATPVPTLQALQGALHGYDAMTVVFQKQRLDAVNEVCHCFRWPVAVGASERAIHDGVERWSMETVEGARRNAIAQDNIDERSLPILRYWNRRPRFPPVISRSA